MAKASVPRHSKSNRKPVTIELESSAINKSERNASNVPAAEPVGFDAAVDEKSPPQAVSHEDQPQPAGPSDAQESFGRGQSAVQTKGSESAPVPAAQKSDRKSVV